MIHTTLTRGPGVQAVRDADSTTGGSRARGRRGRRGSRGSRRWPGGTGVARAQLIDESSGNVDLWYPGSSGTDSGFENDGFSALTPTTVPSGSTYHLGVGTGTGAKVITITESQTQNSSAQTCTFQATAEVVTVG